MKHNRGSSTTPLLAPAWRTHITSQLGPEEWDMLYLHYIEGFDTAALAEALQLRADMLEGPEGRLQEAERHLMEAYASCQQPETVLAPVTPAELVRQLFPPLLVSLPDDFTARVLAQGAQLRRVSAQRAAQAVLWVSGLWHPPFAGERIAAAAETSPQTQHFHVQDGDIHVTCEWRRAFRDQPAMLQLEWRTHIRVPQDLWVRFVRQDDPTAILRELRLGSTIDGQGRVRFSASRLGFDPADATQGPWSLILVLKPRA